MNHVAHLRRRGIWDRSRSNRREEGSQRKKIKTNSTSEEAIKKYSSTRRIHRSPLEKRKQYGPVIIDIELKSSILVHPPPTTRNY